MAEKPERFWVECPGCGKPKGSYSPVMLRAGRNCDCGTTFRVNLEERTAEIIEAYDADENGYR